MNDVNGVSEPRLTMVPSRDGVEVAVHDYGGAGTPTVFIAGTGLCARMWEPVIALLDPDRFRALALDLRGHGASVTPPDTTTFADHDMVADTIAVLDRLGLQQAWAVGHSMGGGTCLLTQADRPDAFERLWVFEPIIFPRPETADGQSAMVEATRRRRPSFASRQEAYDRYHGRPPLDELHPAVLRAYVDHGMIDLPDGTVRLACDPADEAKLFEQFLRDGFSRLGEVAAAVLVAYGSETAEHSGQWAPRIADALPDGRTEVFAGDHHFGCFADLDRVAASLHRWFLDADAD